MTETDGDRELVIGNKQLISLFFVVVALCGVFFAMGYMIGGNSGKATLAEPPASAAAAVQRQPPEPPGDTGTGRPEGAASSAELPAAMPADSAPEGRSNNRAAQEPSPAAARSESQAADHVRGASTAPGASGVSAPEAGASYLQVTALPRADADGVVRTLREQNFPTILATSSKDGLFRVLVGPYHQTTQLAEAKARLKTIGFGSAFVQKQ